MRVITGSARGCTLKSPKTQDTRPTSSSLKESIFSAIQFELSNRVFFDLFAGSGQMGIEALSRGATAAVFVDSGAESCSVIRDNLRHTKLESAARVVNSDVLHFLRNSAPDSCDVAFLDPPYAQNALLQNALSLLWPLVRPGGIIVSEYVNDIGAAPDGFSARNYRYGRRRVVIWRRES